MIMMKGKSDNHALTRIVSLTYVSYKATFFKHTA